MTTNYKSHQTSPSRLEATTLYGVDYLVKQHYTQILHIMYTL